MFTMQGPGLRCGQLVVAPNSSVYGIRPCLSVTRADERGVLRHFNYPRREDGSIDFTRSRVLGR